MKSSDLVARDILDLIAKGEIEPGDKLSPAESIAKRAGVSIISARQALQNLEAIGLIRILHGRGIYLAEGPPIIEELLETRKILECQNIMIATQRIMNSELREIEDLLNKMDEDIVTRDVDSFSERDYDFHASIAKHSGNRILSKIFYNIRNLLSYQQATVNRFPGILESSSARHWEIFFAMKKRDSKLARTIMAKHIDEVIEFWKKFGPGT